MFATKSHSDEIKSTNKANLSKLLALITPFTPSNLDAINAIQLSQYDLDQIEKYTDTNGDTFLHLVMQTNHPECVELFIKKLGNTANNLSIVTNNLGLTPLSIATQCKDTTIRSRLLNLIHPLSVDCSKKKLSPLSEKLDHNVILNIYPEFKKDDGTIKIVKIGCEVINKCRDDIKESETHPHTYEYKNDKLRMLRKNIYLARKKRENVYLTPDEITNLIKNTSVGNCGEFTMLALYYLCNHDCDEIYNIEEFAIDSNLGDHQFVVINRDINSDVNQPLTWGKDAIIIDAWAGKIYPASKFYHEIITHSLFSTIHSLGTFNPKFHRLDQVDRNLYLNFLYTANAAFRTAYTPEEMAAYDNEEKFVSSLNQATQQWISNIEKQPKTYRTRIQELKLSKDEEITYKDSMDKFKDTIRKRIMNIPLRLDGFVYDLSTMINTTDRTDFITPAKDICEEMEKFINKVENDRLMKMDSNICWRNTLFSANNLQKVAEDVVKRSVLGCGLE